MPVEIQIAEPLVRLLKPKRLKIAVGGRGGSKSYGVGDIFLKFIDDGERVCCAREFQNSIDESVHALLKERIEVLGAKGFEATNNKIVSRSGGEAFYRGLARNIGSLRSMFGVRRMWIEEAQYCSEATLDDLMPTIREGGSEIWMTMNRGSSRDPVAQRFLKQAERDLARQGWYEDDFMTVVQINWWDNPWFPAELDQQRQRDRETMSAAKYGHIWGGGYSDTVEDAIIEPEWFDACIDAHTVLGFKAQGVEVVSHDPSGEGDDDKACAYRHGCVIKDVRYKATGEVDEGVDWATDMVSEVGADVFIWDADGMGAGIKRQVSDNLQGKKVRLEMFNGAARALRPDALYEPVDGEIKNPKTNAQTFANRRAQAYWQLRDRMYKTYLAVKKGQGAMYHKDELISFSSDIADLDLLRAEICRIPKKPNGAGKIQIMSKDEMKSRLQIDSPNGADAVMMALAVEAGPAQKITIAANPIC